jgi:drug/metabolite transporter (DMT)-like permease
MDSSEDFTCANNAGVYGLVLTQKEMMPAQTAALAHSSLLHGPDVHLADDTKKQDAGVDASKPLCTAGVALIAGIVVANLSSTVVAENLLTGGTAISPLFMIYHNVSWDIVCFGFYTMARQRGADIGLTVDGAYTPRYVAYHAVMLMVLYQTGNLLYFVGLTGLSVSTVMIFYQSSNAWVLGLSLLLLPGERFEWKKLAAVTATLLGVGMLAADTYHHDESSSSSPLLSMAIMLASSVLWALYEVLFKRWFSAANTVDCLLFVAIRGLSNLVLMWPFLLIANFYGHTELPNVRLGQWGGLILMAFISVFLTLFINMGIVFTSPLFVRVGSTLTAPASLVFVDMIGNHEMPRWARFFGAIYVVIGFIILNAQGSTSIAAVCSPKHTTTSTVLVLTVGLAGLALALASGSR